MNLFTLFYTFTCVAALPRARASLDLLLTAISKIPELSTFYSLFEGTGGELGKPGPDFDERFNDPGIGLLFTAFAPKNDVGGRDYNLKVSTNDQMISRPLLSCHLD